MPIKWFRERNEGSARAEIARERLLDKLGTEMKDVLSDGSSTILVGETKKGEVVVSIDKYNKTKKRWIFGIRYPRSLEKKVEEKS